MGSSDVAQLRELIRALVKRYLAVEKNELVCCGVTMAQCSAIMEIGSSGGLSVVDLASRMSLDKSTLSRTVENLSQLGLVNRDIDPLDRRFVSLTLTEQGSRVYTDINIAFDSYLSKVLESIQLDKKQQVIECLRLLIDAFEHHKCC